MRRAAAALVLAALTLGCGEDDPETRTIADAAQRALELGGMRAQTEYTGSEPRGPRWTLRAVGTEDVRAGTAAYRLTTERLARLLGRELRGRVVKQPFVVYSKDLALETVRRKLELSREWVRFGYDSDLSKGGDREVENTVQLMLQSPAHMLRYARAAKTEGRVGQEHVSGVETTLWRGTVDLSEARDQAAAHERGVLAMDALQMVGEADGTVRIDAWVDSRRALRKVQVRYETAQGPEERTTEILETGVAFEPRPPGPDRVVTADEIRRAEQRRLK